jgi:hypothetical protein
MVGEVFVGILLILIIIMICKCTKSPMWNPHIKKEYIRMIEKYGKPSHVNIIPGGLAVWGNTCVGDTPFERLMIVDENVLHGNHFDFVYATVKISIDSKILSDVLSISDTLMYDKLKEELTSRCSSMETNMATLVLADKVEKGLVPVNMIDEVYKQEIISSNEKAHVNYTILQLMKEEYEYKIIECDT